MIKISDNKIIKALERCSIDYNCGDCPYYYKDEGCCPDMLMNDALDLINRQKSEIERLNKDYEEAIYKLEYLLCYVTGNKFSKHTYPINDMLSFVDDYIQDCCNEAVDETKATTKSEAIKVFAEKFAKELSEFDMSSVGLPDYDRGYKDCMTAIEDTIDNLVKEMTEA